MRERTGVSNAFDLRAVVDGVVVDRAVVDGVVVNVCCLSFLLSMAVLRSTANNLRHEELLPLCFDLPCP